MKRRNILLAAVIVAVLVSSLFLTVEYFYLPDPPTVSPEFYVGVECGYNNITLCKALIDKTKNYTNLFIIGATDIVKNVTLLDEVCDYAYDAGLHFAMYFSPAQTYTDLGENITTSYTLPNGTELQTPSYRSNLPIGWIKSAMAKYGDRFLGAYFYDEPGGTQLDDGALKLVREERDYSTMAKAFVQNLSAKVQPYINSSAMTFTADYGLYWFDYKAGYDAVLADFGFNNSRQLQTSLCRGAANSQNKDWGIMVTHRFSNDPTLESGPELYNDLVLGYDSGAKYAVVFNFAETDWYPKEAYQPFEYGIMEEEHFDALKSFWSYVQNNPDKHDSLKADVALVLPEAYGFGFRNAEDNIWGLFSGNSISQAMWFDVNNYVNEYGSRLDIVYNDEAFNDAAKNSYSQIIYWARSNTSDNFPVHNLNTTMGYATIQEAINSGATFSGHVISIKPGTYRENLVVNKTLSIVGEDKATTIIDGGNRGSAVKITQNNVKLTGFTIKNSGTNQAAGIFLSQVSMCNITDNVVTQNYYGIILNYSDGNLLRNNELSSNVYGLGLDGNESSGFSNDIDTSNTVNGKTVYYLLNAENADLNPSTLPNAGYLALINCTSINVQGLSLSGNYNGLLLVNTQDSTLIDNTIANCNEGIRLLNSENNVLRNNHLNDNTYNFQVQNRALNDVDASNIVNGKPVIYWVNQHDKTVPSDAGFVSLINCSGITVQNLNLTQNWQSILLLGTTNSTIAYNQVSHSYYGIALEASNQNSISDNKVTNSVQGIAFSDSRDNSVTGNTLSDNKFGAYFMSSSYNTLSENVVTANTDHGLQFSSGCDSNTLTGNRIDLNAIAVEFVDSSANNIVQNRLTGNHLSVQIHGTSSHTHIAKNSIAGSICGVEIALVPLVTEDQFERSRTGVIVYSSSDSYYSMPASNSHSISENNLTNNKLGIVIHSVNDTNIAYNNVSGGDYGIVLGEGYGVIMYGYGLGGQTQNDTVQGNIITNSTTGISLSSTSNCSILENQITKGTNGMLLSSSRNNLVVGNVLANMGGLQIRYSSLGNVLRRNSITANVSGFGDEGIEYSYNSGAYYNPATGEILSTSQYVVNDVDASNTVNGKPIIYWVGQSDRTVPSDAACVILVNCTNITVHNLNLTGNYAGILLAYTQNSTMTNNNIQNNTQGIRLMCSSYNNIEGNNIISNDEGIALFQESITTGYGPTSEGITTLYPSTANNIVGNNISSNNYGVSMSSSTSGPSSESMGISGNIFLHNNFMNNRNQVNSNIYSSDQPVGTNSWDNGKEGNYWSDYKGADADQNGLGDTAYKITKQIYTRDGTADLVTGEDRCPLMQPFTK